MDTEMLSGVFSLLGGAAVIGTATTAVGQYLLRLYIEKSVEHRFQNKLEDVKRDNNIAIEEIKSQHIKDIEEIKSSLSVKASRSTKMQEIEFNLLPSLWASILDLYEYSFNVANNKGQTKEDILSKITIFNKEYLAKSIFLDSELRNSANAVRRLILDFLFEEINETNPEGFMPGTHRPRKLEFLLNSTQNLEKLDTFITAIYRCDRWAR
ncbi:hypothetical protein F9K97_05705 [Brucella anthropi]|uniref:hypothetical protein n=1 Tax=Brucella anthropi TaxID=529 RepID=UPI00124F4645|nr:hypothetical protein [Brucella anthropi]KAB2788573.1 hypothetical protein F9K97_05705 [Brucella anthropi]